jgi:hypothetical protein
VIEVVPGEIFTHVDPDDGAIRVFDVTAMLAHAMQIVEQAVVPVAALEAVGIEAVNAAMEARHAEYVLRDCGIEDWKLARLCEPYLRWPALAVELPDRTTLQVDGHHRLVRWYRAGRDSYPLLRFRLGAWEPFLLEVPPEIRDRLVREAELGRR